MEVPLSTREGLARPSVVNLDNIHVVPAKILGERIGQLPQNRTGEVKRALGYALDWAELKVVP